MIPLWIVLSATPALVVLIVLVNRWKGAPPKPSGKAKNDGVLIQLATLEERTKQLQGLEETWRSKNCPGRAREVELIC
jgi:hypothetical protein